MIMSIDAYGVVAISTVVKIMIVYKLTRYVVIDPTVNHDHIYSVLAPRF